MTKSLLAAVLLVLSAAGVAAQDSLSTQVAACLPITGMLQRLACYDRVAHTLAPAPVPRSASLPRPPASAAPAAMALAPPVAAAPSGLGSERLPRTASLAPKRPQEMIFGVASVNRDARGRFTITLDNGQVWRQLEGDTAELTGSKVTMVRISRGALGSYDLNIVGRNATFRVTRLQ